jgi:hypothetical protein
MIVVPVCPEVSRMPSRRAILASLVAASVVPMVAGPATAFSPGLAPGSDGLRPEIRPWGRFFIVNGWVLTAQDLETLGLA